MNNVGISTTKTVVFNFDFLTKNDWGEVNSKIHSSKPLEIEGRTKDESDVAKQFVEEEDNGATLYLFFLTCIQILITEIFHTSFSFLKLGHCGSKSGSRRKKIKKDKHKRLSKAGKGLLKTCHPPAATLNDLFEDILMYKCANESCASAVGGCLRAQFQGNKDAFVPVSRKGSFKKWGGVEKIRHRSFQRSLH